MELDNVLANLVKWKDEYASVLLKSSLMGAEPWTSMLEDLELIVSMLNDPVIGKPLETISLAKVSTPDRLSAMGIGKEIIDLYNKGLEYKEISSVLSLRLGDSITSSEVEEWIDTFSNMSVLDKPLMIRGSVFETKGRLEEMHLLIHKHLEYIESVSDDIYSRSKTTKAQVLTEAYRELRQLYKDANTLLASIQQLNTITEFQQVVLDVIANISPSAYQQIVKELKDKKALMSALLP